MLCDGHVTYQAAADLGEEDLVVHGVEELVQALLDDPIAAVQHGRQQAHRRTEGDLVRDGHKVQRENGRADRVQVELRLGHALVDRVPD